MENVRSQCRRLQDGRVVYVAEVLVAIQYNVLVVTSGYTRSVVDDDQDGGWMSVSSGTG